MTRHYREDDETVISICYRDDDLMFSTSRYSLAARCQAKWGQPEVLLGDDGKPRRWVWRKAPLAQLRFTPRSASDVQRASANALKVYKNRGVTGFGRS